MVICHNQLQLRSASQSISGIAIDFNQLGIPLRWILQRNSWHWAWLSSAAACSVEQMGWRQVDVRVMSAWGQPSHSWGLKLVSAASISPADLNSIWRVYKRFLLRCVGRQEQTSWAELGQAQPMLNLLQLFSCKLASQSIWTFESTVLFSELNSLLLE